MRLMERARVLGYRELVLDTLENNPGAQKLFESCGFTENRRGMRGHYHLIFYAKQL
jgi:ribosomal protein S18 acetylase RimI-like enzyme